MQAAVALLCTHTHTYDHRQTDRTKQLPACLVAVSVAVCEVIVVVVHPRFRSLVLVIRDIYVLHYIGIGQRDRQTAATTTTGGQKRKAIETIKYTPPESSYIANAGLACSDLLLCE